MKRITKTTQGATMSPRMSRLWTYLRIDCKIHLTDFSTDQGVEREIGKLQAALDAVQGDSLDAENLRRDIRAIMRRRPANRIGGNR